MKKLFLIIGISLLISGCTHKDSTAIKLLQSQGYTNIQLTGYDLFRCSKDDTFATGFKAILNKKPVKGVICGGILKGSTIRLY